MHTHLDILQYGRIFSLEYIIELFYYWWCYIFILNSVRAHTSTLWNFWCAYEFLYNESLYVIEIHSIQSRKKNFIFISMNFGPLCFQESDGNFTKSMAQRRLTITSWSLCLYGLLYIFLVAVFILCKIAAKSLQRCIRMRTCRGKFAVCVCMCNTYLFQCEIYQYHKITHTYLCTSTSMERNRKIGGVEKGTMLFDVGLIGNNFRCINFLLLSSYISINHHSVV